MIFAGAWADVVGGEDQACMLLTPEPGDRQRKFQMRQMRRFLALVMKIRGHRDPLGGALKTLLNLRALSSIAPGRARDG